MHFGSILLVGIFLLATPRYTILVDPTVIWQSSLKYYCMSWHIRWPFSLKIAFKDGVDLYTKGNEKSPILGLRAKTWGLADFPPVIGGNSRHSYCLLRESQVVCVCVQSPWKELCSNWAKELAWLLCKDIK